MIITEEELLALLGSDVSQKPVLHPVSIYALDAASYQAVKALGVHDDASLHRTQPDSGWQWEQVCDPIYLQDAAHWQGHGISGRW